MTKTPITIISGFLGSGKTTFLDYAVKNSNKRLCIILNDLGDNIGESLEIVDQTSETLHWVDLPNGCVCCHSKNNLILALEQIANTNNFDNILIELNGLADPSAVAEAIWSNDDLSGTVYCSSIITFVDAENFTRTETDTMANRQIASADLLVLNKSHKVDQSILQNLCKTLIGINALAKIIISSWSKIDLEEIWNKNTMQQISSLNKITKTHVNLHHQYNTINIRFTFPITKKHVKTWLSELMWEGKYDIVRIKGVVDIVDATNRYMVQGVCNNFELKKSSVLWMTGDVRESIFVIVGKLLVEKELLELYLSIKSAKNSKILAQCPSKV